MTENNAFHSFGLLICSAIFIYIIFNKFEKKNWLFYLAILTFLVSPFLLTIFLAQEPPIRAQTPIPFVLGLSAYYLYLNSNNNLEKKIYKIVFGILIFMQIIFSVEMFYTANESFKQQKIFATQIENDISARNIESTKPQVFIGQFSASGPNMLLKEDSMGGTFFEWDTFRYKGNNDRIGCFLRLIGYKDYNFISGEQYEQAKKISADMPVYPEEGSIREEKDFVIIKISE